MNKTEIGRHDARLDEITRLFRSAGASGKAKDFHCPILQIEEPAVLCKGHIVPKSVRGRRWVVQRKDVDNFFGWFAEAGFIHGVKLRSKGFEDALAYVIERGLARRVDLSVVDGDGTRGSVHPTGRHAGGREVVVRSQDGTLDLGGDLSLSMGLDVRYETLLALLHTAHLGNFEGAGYAYATSRSARFVASLLRDVYLRFSGSNARNASRTPADRAQQLEAMCRAHVNMVRPLPSVAEFNKELLEDPFRSFVLCWCGNAVFAAIHLLQADSEWNAVMVYADIDRRAIAMMGATTAVSFKSTRGRVENGIIRAGPVRDDSTTMVWPCGEDSDPAAAVPVEEAVARLPPGPFG